MKEEIDVITPLLSSAVDDLDVQELIATTTLRQRLFNNIKELIKYGLNLSSSAVVVALSYTFSLSLIAIIIMLNASAKKNAGTNEGALTEALAANTLIVTSLNFVDSLALSPLLSMRHLVNKPFGEYNALLNLIQQKEKQTNLALLRKEISILYRNGLVLGLLPVTMAICSLLYSKSILVALGQDPPVAELVSQFLTNYSVALVFQIFRVLAEQFIFTFGKGKIAMRIGLISLITSTALAGWFCFGGAGLPALGAQGVALGFVIESFITAMAYNLYLYRATIFQEFTFFRWFQNSSSNVTQLKRLFFLGLSYLLKAIPDILLPFTIGILASFKSKNEQAAWNFAMQVVLSITLFSLAFGQVTTQEMDKLLGAKNYLQARKVVFAGMGAALSLNAIPALIVGIWPELLLKPFGNQLSSLQSILPSLMPIVSTGTLGLVAENMLLQTSRSLGKAGSATTISIACLMGGIITAIGLSTEKSSDLISLSIVYAGCILLAALLLLPMWLLSLRKENLIKASLQKSNSFSCGFFSCWKQTEIANRTSSELQLDYGML